MCIGTLSLPLPLLSLSFLELIVDDKMDDEYLKLENWNIAGTGMGAAAVFERGDCVDELCNAKKVVGGVNLLSKDAR